MPRSWNPAFANFFFVAAGRNVFMGAAAREDNRAGELARR